MARRRLAQSIPRPHRIERDMTRLWSETAATIRDALAACPQPASDIAAIAVTAHDDGLYLLDAAARPLGPGILSLDSRAGGTVARWQADGINARALAISGQMPHASAPAALLAWIRQNEPERYARIAHVLACKDWLRACLTGRIATDLTEASTSFTDVRTQAYSPDLPDLFGLPGIAGALPPILAPDALAGHVIPEAAALTGLAAGTPVAAGLHDVTASALGAGGFGAGGGEITLIAGTYSINELPSTAPRIDPRWFCRNGLHRGEWNNMAISPASAGNYDWFLDRFWQAERQAAEAAGRDIHAEIGPVIEAALQRESSALFHPFLFGSPYGAEASGGFFGLRGWHGRPEMMRAVIEGIAMNHRLHVDALRDGFGADRVRLTGGLSRNPAFAQLFADTLDMPVTTCAVDEPAAWGAALCAGAAVGLYGSPRHDPRDLSALSRAHHPDPARSRDMARRYALFQGIADALGPLWPKIDALAAGDG
ncbi:MAG: FGGY-family carbohydrate kinase, partial [Paracoccus sp. (in: a-proteobacteria)]|nr:FGGY-family carbohydrate kinase [Paracoccus sp. (in: a-proteobacteria)]